MFLKSCSKVFRTNFNMNSCNLSSGKRLRIVRIIANSGVGSRSEVIKMIARGRVTVDGVVVRGPGQMFHVNDNILVNGFPLDKQTDEVLLVQSTNSSINM